MNHRCAQRYRLFLRHISFAVVNDSVSMLVLAETTLFAVPSHPEITSSHVLLPAFAMGFFFTRLFRNIVLVVVAFTAVQFLLRIKSYTISPKEFRTGAAKAAGCCISQHFRDKQVMENFDLSVLKFYDY